MDWDFSVIAAIISLKFSLNSPFWCVIMCSHIACWVHLKRFLSVHVAFGSISKRFIDSFWTHSCVLCSIVHKLCYYFRLIGTAAYISLGLIWLGFDLLRLALIAQLLKHSINLSSRRYLSCYIWSWKVWRTFGLSAPLFINSGDFLQIEIYYNKKHLFLVELRFLDLSDEKCRDFLFSGGDFLFSADDLLEIEIY